MVSTESTLAALDGATIAFDLDGTLVDTAPDLLRALNAVMDLEGLPHPPADELRKMVGHGARVLIERATARVGVTFTPDHLDQAVATFIEAYRADIAALSRPWPGVEAALSTLAAAGARMVVCTNKRTDLSVELLDALGLTGRFAAIVGSDAVPARKPDPGHYLAAIARAGGDVVRSVMVGDSSTDVRASQAAGAPCILVRFGYLDASAEALGADVVIDHFDELAATAAQLLIRRR